MIRFESTSPTVEDLLKKVRTERFPELKNAKIITLFDLKKRTSVGQIVLARIMRTNDLLRHLTRDEAVAVQGYDYIIGIDKAGWEAILETDRIRLMSHELRHTHYDIESEENPYKIVDHDITDFHAEVELNRDDPRWRERVAALISDIYEQAKDDQGAKKGNHKGQARLF